MSGGGNIITLTKIYPKELRYRGSKDYLDESLVVFYDYCNKMCVPSLDYAQAFSCMLVDEALRFYYDYVMDPAYDF